NVNGRSPNFGLIPLFWSEPGGSCGDQQNRETCSRTPPIISWRNGMSSSGVDIQEARALSLNLSDEALSVDLVDGRTVIVPLVWYPRLWHGSEQERNNFEIFGDGAYMHWPDLDEDLTVAGLLEGKRSGESPTSLKKWLAARKPRGRRHAPKPSRLSRR